MKREEFSARLRRETSVCVPPALKERVARAAQAQQEVYMKNKIPAAVVFALIAVLLCGAALAAASRWGMMDFLAQRRNAYVPEDAAQYVQRDIAFAENELASAHVREMHYDGRTCRLTIDVTPRQENTLMIGMGGMDLGEPYVSATGEAQRGGVHSIYSTYVQGGYAHLMQIDALMHDDSARPHGSMRWRQNEEGVLTLLLQWQYEEDLPRREATVNLYMTPFDEPIERDSQMNRDRREKLSIPLALMVMQSEAQETYVSSAPVEFPEAGVRVDVLRIDVKPQEIFATIEYTVIDRAAFARHEELCFEFVDPTSEAHRPEQQRLKSGFGFYEYLDTLGEEPAARYVQTLTLGRNELHETYTLRAFGRTSDNLYGDARYDTKEIHMRPATADDL